MVAIPSEIEIKRVLKEWENGATQIKQSMPCLSQNYQFHQYNQPINESIKNKMELSESGVRTEDIWVY